MADTSLLLGNESPARDGLLRRVIVWLRSLPTLSWVTLILATAMIVLIEGRIWRENPKLVLDRHGVGFQASGMSPISSGPGSALSRTIDHHTRRVGSVLQLRFGRHSRVTPELLDALDDCSSVWSLQWDSRPFASDAASVIARLPSISTLFILDCTAEPANLEQSSANVTHKSLSTIVVIESEIDLALVSQLPQAPSLTSFEAKNCTIHDDAAKAIVTRYGKDLFISLKVCKVGPKTLSIFPSAKTGVAGVTTDPSLADPDEPVDTPVVEPEKP